MAKQKRPKYNRGLDITAIGRLETAGRINTGKGHLFCSACVKDLPNLRRAKENRSYSDYYRQVLYQDLQKVVM